MTTSTSIVHPGRLMNNYKQLPSRMSLFPGCTLASWALARSTQWAVDEGASQYASACCSPHHNLRSKSMCVLWISFFQPGAAATERNNYALGRQAGGHRRRWNNIYAKVSEWASGEMRNESARTCMLKASERARGAKVNQELIWRSFKWSLISIVLIHPGELGLNLFTMLYIVELLKLQNENCLFQISGLSHIASSHQKYKLNFINFVKLILKCTQILQFQNI